MKALAAVFFAYAIINFGIFMFLMIEGGPQAMEDGTYAISNHGRFVRYITESEFHKYQGCEARGFSGHWMAFYSISMAALASRFRSGRTT